MAIVETTKVTPVTTEADFLHIDDDAEDFVLCKNPDKLKRLIDAVEKGGLIHFVSDGDWSMHDLVIELLKKYAPAEIFFSTYALREFSVRQLITALEKKHLIGVNILIDAKARARTPQVIQLAEMNVNRIRLTSIHAKVCIIRSPKGYVSINASANWTTNPRIESGTISTNEKVALFHIDWMEKIMDNAEIFE